MQTNTTTTNTLARSTSWLPLTHPFRSKCDRRSANSTNVPPRSRMGGWPYIHAQLSRSRGHEGSAGEERDLDGHAAYGRPATMRRRLPTLRLPYAHINFPRSGVGRSPGLPPWGATVICTYRGIDWPIEGYIRAVARRTSPYHHLTRPHAGYAPRDTHLAWLARQPARALHEATVWWWCPPRRLAPGPAGRPVSDMHSTRVSPSTCIIWSACQVSQDSTRNKAAA